MNPRQILLCSAIAVSVLLTGGADAASGSASKSAVGPVERGKALFVGVGCYECHGTVGQGGFGAGPAIAPDPMGIDSFRMSVRAPRNQMPAYGETILTNAQLNDLYAYLKSIPRGRPPDRIWLLPPGAIAKAASLTTAELAKGRTIYAANCSACHGANLEGGQLGAPLTGETTKRSLQSTIELIKKPPNGMPRLFPSPLSDSDLPTLAAYVRHSP
jgi:ubiquinol-cytochrome c reductase cytochrome c subunit